MRDFELPSNIRQIGAIADGLKVYMEDYVCTYLKQYADTGGHTEKLAFLIGKEMVIDGQRYVFISGAVQGKYSAPDEGGEVFTDKSCAYCEEQLKTYFPGLSVVGWMQSQPGFGAFLSPAAADYHMARFTEPCNVLFLLDPEERVNTFYAWDENLTGISEAGGYFIYYDKNPQMQSYMADNKLILPRVFEPSAQVKPTRVKRADTEAAPAYAERERRPGGDNRKVVNMLVSLSAVLVVVCFVMGAGLVQNDGRISAMEKELVSLNSTYAYLVSQLRTAGTEPVFAPQDSASGPDDGSAQGEDDLVQSADNPDSGTSQNTDDPAQAIDGVTDVDVPNADGNMAGVTPAPVPTPTATPVPTVEPTPTPPAEPTATPEGEPTAATEPAVVMPEYEIYLVQQGDSLLQISEQLYGTANMVEEIMVLNDMTDPDKIFFGKELKIPKRQ